MNTIIQIPNFMEEEHAALLFTLLQNNINWTKMNYFKRHISHYDGSIIELNSIIDIIESTFSRTVAGAFLNYYENGNEYAPYHADKYNCDTCLLSLGTSRILRYKHNQTGENTDYTLNSGDLLFIPDEINHFYKHSLLKRTKLNDPRISILFFLE